MRKYKLMSAVLLLTMGLSVSGCGADAQKEDSSAKAQNAIEAAVDAAQQSEAEDLKEENLGSNEGKDLSSYEKLYTFTLDGKEYHMSCPAQELFDDGWVFSNDAVTMDGPNVITLNEAIEKGTKFDVVETPDFTVYKTIDGETYKMMVGLCSDSTEPKTLGEYRLDYIYVNEETGLDFELGTGITFGDKEKTVREVYGEPTSEAEGILSYQFTGGEVALMPNRPEFMNFYVNEGKVYMVSMQYFPVLSK